VRGCRSTTKTVVSANGGLIHEGLGLDVYVQATSSVRRFCDLAVHYQFKAFLRVTLFHLQVVVILQ